MRSLAAEVRARSVGDEREVDRGGYVIYDDPGSLLYCAALLGVGVVLFIAERVLGSGTPTTDLES